MDRHVILTLGRSGSNSLHDMLNQSPHVLNFGEVLGEWNSIRKAQRRLPFLPRSDEAFLDWILMSPGFPRMANLIRSARVRLLGKGQTVKGFRRIKTFGVKDFSLNFERFGLTDYLSKRPTIKVIGLVREGIVERMISNAMLASTGVVAVTSGGNESTTQLTLDPDIVEKLLARIEAENAGLESMLTNLPPDRVQIVRYEDLFSDTTRQEAILGKVFSFLGVPPVQTKVRTTKIIRQPTSKVVSNFDACLAALRGTPYEALWRDAADKV